MLEEQFSWDEVFRNKIWGEYPSESLIRFAAKYLYGTDSRILEVGCGTGTNLLFLAKHGLICTGVDVSRVALSQARLRFSQTEMSVDLIHSDVNDFNFSDKMYDVFLDNECCYILKEEDALRVYHAAYTSLQEGGLMYIKTFSKDTSGYSTAKSISGKRWLTNKGPLNELGPARFMTRWELAELLDFAKDIEINEYNYTIEHGNELVSELVAVVRK